MLEPTRLVLLQARLVLEPTRLVLQQARLVLEPATCLSCLLLMHVMFCSEGGDVKAVYTLYVVVNDIEYDVDLDFLLDSPKTASKPVVDGELSEQNEQLSRPTAVSASNSYELDCLITPSRPAVSAKAPAVSGKIPTVDRSTKPLQPPASSSSSSSAVLNNSVSGTAVSTGQSVPTVSNTGQSAATVSNTSQSAPTVSNTGQSAPTASNTGQSAPTVSHINNKLTSDKNVEHVTDSGPMSRPAPGTVDLPARPVAAGTTKLPVIPPPAPDRSTKPVSAGTSSSAEAGQSVAARKEKEQAELSVLQAKKMEEAKSLAQMMREKKKLELELEKKRRLVDDDLNAL